jgi:hypothetical protein
VALVSALCLASVAGRASVIRIDVTLEELMGNSDLVVQGRVGRSIGTVWYGSVDRMIFTKHEFTIVRVLYGPPPADRVVLLTAGGPIPSEGYPEPVVVTSDGSIQVEEGEDILAFLKHTDRNEYRFAGFAHGKFDLRARDGLEPAIAIRTRRPDLLPAGAQTTSAERKPEGATLNLSELQEFIQCLRADARPNGESRNAGR